MWRQLRWLRLSCLPSSPLITGDKTGTCSPASSSSFFLGPVRPAKHVCSQMLESLPPGLCPPCRGCGGTCSPVSCRGAQREDALLIKGFNINAAGIAHHVRVYQGDIVDSTWTVSLSYISICSEIRLQRGMLCIELYKNLPLLHISRRDLCSAQSLNSFLSPFRVPLEQSSLITVHMPNPPGICKNGDSDSEGQG